MTSNIPQKSNTLSQTTLAERLFTFSFNENGDVFVTPKESGSGKTIPIEHKMFKQQFRYFHVNQFGKQISNRQYEELIDYLKAKVLKEKNPESVFVRVGRNKDELILDTGRKFIIFNKTVNSRVTEEIDQNFFRPSDTITLPDFSLGGESFDLLKKYLTISDSEYRLLLGYITYSMIDLNAPYPILIINGEKGSSKTTMSKVIKKIVDNNKTLIESFPNKEDDFYMIVKNTHLSCFDNLSGITNKMSDNLCKVATGVAYRKRKLYSNDELVSTIVKKPILLNGIDKLAYREDLQDRSIVLNLKAINMSQRISEQEFWKNFDSDFSEIISSLITLISRTYKGLDDVGKLDRLPRLADYGKWCASLYSVLGHKKNDFSEEFLNLQAEARKDIFENCIIFNSLKKLYYDKQLNLSNGEYPLLEATTSQLYNTLAERTLNFSKVFNSLNSFSRELKRLTPSLKEEGIVIEDYKRTPDKRLKRIIYTKDFSDNSHDEEIKVGTSKLTSHGKYEVFSMEEQEDFDI